MRSTNPMNPSYTIRDENGNLFEIGQVEGSKPYVLPPERKDEKFKSTSLKTGDIMGAKADTKGKGVFAENHERKEFKETNRMNDIEGAFSGSLKKGPTTTRISNPLEPNYAIPGFSELANPNDVYGQPKVPLF
jgi:hypothetical protein